MSTKTTKQTVDQLKTAKKYLSAVDGRAHYLTMKQSNSLTSSTNVQHP